MWLRRAGGGLAIDLTIFGGGGVRGYPATSPGRARHARLLAAHHAADSAFAGRRVRSGLPQRPRWRACRRGCAASARGGRCWRARASCRAGVAGAPPGRLRGARCDAHTPGRGAGGGNARRGDHAPVSIRHRGVGTLRHANPNANPNLNPNPNPSPSPSPSPSQVRCGTRWPYVLFSASPSGNDDYAATVASALAYWDKDAPGGRFVFTSSAGVCAEQDGGVVTETSPAVLTRTSRGLPTACTGSRVPAVLEA